MERNLALVGLTLSVFLLACGAPPAARSGDENAGQPARGLKRVVAAIGGDPPTFSSKINQSGAGNVPGGSEIERLLLAGLSVRDDSGNQAPLLAESIPRIDGGSWQLRPDGRMTTTWKLRPGTFWHDGAPLTAEDVVFTARVENDGALPLARAAAYEAVANVLAVDERTVTVEWSRPYIYADRMFASWLVPRHLIERPYLEDKSNFTQLPYFSRDFVGTGPFKLREWSPGSHVVMAANEQYVLGRPKIDEITVKFILDHETLLANVLAGEVELVPGRSISLEQGAELASRWKQGQVNPGAATTYLVAYPQLIDPNPAVVANVGFRQALMHAVDRQEMADTIQGGILPVAHSYTSPSEPEFERLQGDVVRYEYDARRAVQMIEGLGYIRGADGMFREASGRPLSVELNTTGESDIHVKTQLGMAEHWKRAGVAVDAVLIPQQRARDREYRATYPGFRVSIQSNSLSSLDRFHTNAIPLPENRFVGDNYPRYSNRDLDPLLERYFVTVPLQERLEVLRQIERRLTSEAIIMPQFYSSNPFMVGNRLRNVGTSKRADLHWNIHEWDVV